MLCTPVTIPRPSDPCKAARQCQLTLALLLRGSLVMSRAITPHGLGYPWVSVNPQPIPVKTRAHGRGYGFWRVWARVTLENPRVARDIPYVWRDDMAMVGAWCGWQWVGLCQWKQDMGRLLTFLWPLLLTHIPGIIICHCRFCCGQQQWLVSQLSDIVACLGGTIDVPHCQCDMTLRWWVLVGLLWLAMWHHGIVFVMAGVHTTAAGWGFVSGNEIWGGLWPFGGPCYLLTSQALLLLLLWTATVACGIVVLLLSRLVLLVCAVVVVCSWMMVAGGGSQWWWWCCQWWWWKMVVVLV